MEVTSDGSPIARNPNWAASKRVPKKVAGGKVRVAEQVRADESKAARDDGLQARMCAGPESAEMLRGALALGIGGSWGHRIRAAAEILGNVRQVRRLRTVDRTRRGEEKTGGSGRRGEGQHATRPFYTGIEHLPRRTGILGRAGLGGRMDHEVEAVTGFRLKPAHITRAEAYRRIVREVRRTARESRGIAR